MLDSRTSMLAMLVFCGAAVRRFRTVSFATSRRRPDESRGPAART